MRRIVLLPSALLLCLVACSSDATGPGTSPEKLVFTAQPTAVWATQPFTSIAVTSQGSNGQTDETFEGDVVLTLAGGSDGAMLTGTRVARAVRGVATFPGLSVDRPGSEYTLHASADRVTAAAVSSRFTVTATPHLVFSAVPDSFRTGTPMPPGMQVTLQTDAGATVADFTGKISLSLVGAGTGTLRGTTAATAVSGVATLNGVILDGLGANFVLKAESPYTIAAQSHPLASEPVLRITQGPIGAVSGRQMDPGIQVVLRDALGATVTGFNGPVSIALRTNPAGGTLGGTLSVNAVGGIATFPDLTVSRPGDGYVLAASNTGFVGDTSAQFSVGCYLWCWTSPGDAPIDQSEAASGIINGKLYVAGGFIRDNYTVTGALEMYDPASGTWQDLAPMPTARFTAAATVAGGLLYVLGGAGAGAADTTVEAYNPTTNTWTTLAPMPIGRHDLGVSAVGGLLYVVGGIDSTGYGTPVVDIYDPGTNTWSTGPAMTEARFDLGVTTLDGKVMAIAGERNVGAYGNPEYTNSVEFLALATGTWTLGAALPGSGGNIAATTNGTDAYVAGQGKDVFRYNGATGAWEALNPLPVEVASPSIGATDSEVYVVAGGTLWLYRLKGD